VDGDGRGSSLCGGGHLVHGHQMKLGSGRLHGEATPCGRFRVDFPTPSCQLADVAPLKAAFDGVVSPRQRDRRLCGGRMSGASLARRRIDEYDRRPHSTTKRRSSARRVAPAPAPCRSAIEVPSSATVFVDGAAGRSREPAEGGLDRLGGRRVAQERALRARASRAELVVAAVVDSGSAGWPQRHLYACGHKCEYLFRTVIDSSC
jgi:hypothetical protein